MGETRGNTEFSVFSLAPCNQRRRLYPKIFDFNFQNISSYGRKSTFLCFEVERWKNGSFINSLKGVFRNQVCAPRYGHQRQELSQGRRPGA